MPETTFTYNGVSFKNVLTESIDQEVIPEPTGVDPLFVRVTVSMTGILHTVSGGTPITIGRTTGGIPLASGYNAIIDDLMQPRRRFTMIVDGVTLFDVIPGMVRPGVPNLNSNLQWPLNQTDVNNGPVTSVRVLNVISGNTLKVHFTVVMHLPYCDVPGTTPGGIISLRFWIADDINCEDWTTVRTYYGRLRVAHMFFNIHKEFRKNFVMPPLQKGFRRRRITLNQSPDGLELEFTIQDVEQWAHAPGPATHWDGYHVLSSPIEHGVYCEQEVYVKLTSDKNTPKRTLLRLAQQILETKLHFEERIKAGNLWLQFWEMKEALPNNEVEARARIRIVGGPASQYLKGNLADDIDDFGRPLITSTTGTGTDLLNNYDKEVARLANPTANIKGLFLAALNDPCHVSGLKPAERKDDEPAQKPQQPQGTENVEIVDQGATLDKQVSLYNQDEHQSGSPYNIYRLTSETDCAHGKIQLPYGKTSPTTNDTSVVLCVHKPIAQRRIVIDAERIDKWPTLPRPEDFDAGSSGGKHTLLSAHVHPSAPQLSADGRRNLHHVIYELQFALTKCPTGNFLAALLPYRIAGNSNNQDSVYVVPASRFVAAQGFLYPQGSA